MKADLVISLSARGGPHAGSRIRNLASQDVFRIGAFLAAHVVLALLMYGNAHLATLHGFATFLAGIWLVVSRRKPEWAAYWGAYITGAEVLWRMTHAMIFWEFGKYAVSAILIAAMLRSRPVKVPAFPLLYFTLLLPSTVSGMMDMVNQDRLSPFEIRSTLSFNLSGPFALMISAWFFSNLKVSTKQLNLIFLAAIGPILAIATITLYHLLSAGPVEFGTQSSKVTSGGFGPNQVSTALGLGALMAFLYAMKSRDARGLQTIVFVLMFWFIAQCAMTFSRGGLYNASVGAMLASIYLLRDARTRLKLIFSIGILLFVVGVFLLPRLDQFTGGALLKRFEDTDVTGRDLIVKAQLEVWKEYPIFGVGPGRAEGIAPKFFHVNITHTEFSRLLAEHGSFGLAALILVLVMAVQSLMRAPTAKGKALSASMIAWSFVDTLHAAMRLVAPSFLFGLAFVTVLPEEKPGPVEAPYVATPNNNRTSLKSYAWAGHRDA